MGVAASEVVTLERADVSQTSPLVKQLDAAWTGLPTAVGHFPQMLASGYSLHYWKNTKPVLVLCRLHTRLRYTSTIQHGTAPKH